jgi:Uncharacterized protein conserved in bacteria
MSRPGDRPALRGSLRVYLLCTTPRSGSTLLCRMLQAMGQAGRPDPHFHVPHLSAWLEDYRLDPATLPSRTAALRAAPAG